MKLLIADAEAVSEFARYEICAACDTWVGALAAAPIVLMS